MAGQRRQEMHQSKPDIGQGNAFLMKKEHFKPQTLVSLEMWWPVQLQACKYKDVPSYKQRWLL